MKETKTKKNWMSRNAAWGLQGIALTVLVLGICLLFWLSEDDRFGHVIQGEGYVSTADFSYHFFEDVERAIRYTKLAEKLEKDGELNLQADVAEMPVAENILVCFTLQDAINYGESLGLYFDEENRLVTADGEITWRQPPRGDHGADLQQEGAGMASAVEAEVSPEGISQEAAVQRTMPKDQKPVEGIPEIVKRIMQNDMTEEEFLQLVENGVYQQEKPHLEEEWMEMPPEETSSNTMEEYVEYEAYYTGDLEKEEQEEQKFLLKLLYQLAEYYELHDYLGIDAEEEAKTNFAYRFVYLNNLEQVVVASNQMNGGSVQDILDLGYYFWTNSEQDDLRYTFYADVVSSVYSAVVKGGLLAGDTYEVVAGVNLAFPVEDAYARGYQSYQQYRWMVYGTLAVLAIGVVALLAALYRLLKTSEDVASDRDEWYTEASVLVLALTAFLCIWGVVGVQDSFRDHDVPTLCTGLFFSCLMYYLVVTGICSLLRCWKGQRFRSGSLLVRAGQELLDSYQNVGRGKFSLFGILIGYLMMNVLLTGVLVLVVEDILSGDISAGNHSLVLGGCVLGLLLLNGAAFLYAGRRARHGRRITEALNAISGGAIDTKIDVKGMRGQDKGMAEAINTIGDGLIKALEEKTSSERMKTDLIANVSHDLRTPLTSIINYVDLLKREEISNPKAREYLEILENKSLRMKHLAEDLMDASKVSSGNMTVNWARIDLVQMVNQMEGEFQERFEAAELTPVTDLVAPPVYIQADGRLLFRVLENLYNNVCKYAMKGTRVYIDLRETSHKAVFTIKNISADPLNITAEELTGRFVRGDVSRTTEGSGLGLSIAQSITELLKGTFEIYLEGDLFRVRLIFPLDETNRSA